MIKSKKLEHQIFIIAFLMMLILPNIVLLFGLEKGITNNENIKFETPPKFNFVNPNKTIRNYKSYYLGNYGLKKTLVNQYIYFKSEILKENPLPDKVIVGKEGWFFLGNYYAKVLNSTFNNTQEKIKIEQATQNLKIISNYLNKKNILFYLAVAPNKHSIYKKYLPYQLNQNSTFYDQLIKKLDKNNINYINLKKVLLEKKTDDKIYYKTDSHWNKLGAFYAYAETTKILSKKLNITPLSLNDYIVNKSIKPINDLSKMINIYKKEQNFELIEKVTHKIDTLSTKFYDLIFRNPDKQLKLLMSRDSFSDAWISYFNDTFNETRFIKNYNKITPQLIEQYKPDVVIYEIVERNLPNLANPILLKNP